MGYVASPSLSNVAPLFVAIVALIVGVGGWIYNSRTRATDRKENARLRQDDRDAAASIRDDQQVREDRIREELEQSGRTEHARLRKWDEYATLTEILYQLESATGAAIDTPYRPKRAHLEAGRNAVRFLQDAHRSISRLSLIVENDSVLDSLMDSIEAYSLIQTQLANREPRTSIHPLRRQAQTSLSFAIDWMRFDMGVTTEAPTNQPGLPRSAT